MASLHAPDGNQPEKKSTKGDHTGETSLSRKDFYFSGSLIYFLLYIGMNTESHGVSRPDPYQNQVLYTNVYKGLGGFTSSSGHEAC